MKIIKILGFLFLGIALVSFSLNIDLDKTTDLKTSNVVMAYYVPEKDYDPAQLPLDQLTHIIFSFTNIIEGEMKFRHEVNGEKLKQLVAQRKNHPNLKVMIACGGWGADGFSDMAHTAENRKKFVQSVIEFNKGYELDGLDQRISKILLC